MCKMVHIGYYIWLCSHHIQEEQLDIYGLIFRLLYMAAGSVVLLKDWHFTFNVKRTSREQERTLQRVSILIFWQAICFIRVMLPAFRTIILQLSKIKKTNAYKYLFTLVHFLAYINLNTRKCILSRNSFLSCN